ncbi:MAG TPA: MOSC domain-containing protein [Humisphaera sp.]
MPGTLEGIFIAAAAKVPMVSVPSAVAVVGLGLEGDRYHLGVGAFSRWPGEGRQVTLIEAEAVEAILAEAGIDLREGRHRRNLVTRGVPLDALVGRRFRVGPVVLRGQRLCAPCRYLERMTGDGTYTAMRGRGGLRTEVIEGGTVAVGDAVEI